MRRKKNLKKLLNLGLLDYTNLTPKIGEMDMPYIRCQTIPTLDYLATYSQPSTYFRTSNTAVSFFEYDVFFDGLYGLWSAIYYGIAELQDFYRERFHGVRCFIAPDFFKVWRRFRSRKCPSAISLAHCCHLADNESERRCNPVSVMCKCHRHEIYA